MWARTQNPDKENNSFINDIHIENDVENEDVIKNISIKLQNQILK